jgi:uncharacterized protein YjbI with pentapeptide repeats
MDLSAGNIVMRSFVRLKRILKLPTYEELAGANLCYADMARSDLSHTNLSHANICSSIITDIVRYNDTISEQSDYKDAIMNSRELVDYLRIKNAKNVPEPTIDEI